MFWEMGGQNALLEWGICSMPPPYLREIVIIHPDGWRMSMLKFSQITPVIRGDLDQICGADQAMQKDAKGIANSKPFMLRIIGVGN